MRLLDLHIDGFGCLVERTFQFSPGLNLIHGPNEAGKSTLQQAIWAALYGFYDESSVTTAKRGSVAAKQPWDPSAKYSLFLTYELDNGYQYQVERVFAPRQRTTLISLPNEIDISADYPRASQGRLFFAESQLGVDRVVFENTCCLRQTELVMLEQSATAITDTLLRFASSGSTNETASGAIATLDAVLREQIGTPRAWTKPLGKTLKSVDEAKKREQQAQVERNNLLLEWFRLNQIQDHVNQLELQKQRLEFETLLAKQNSLRENRAKVTETTAAVLECTKERDRWQLWSAFPIALEGRITEMAEKRRSLVATATDIDLRAHDVASNLLKLQVEIGKTHEHVIKLEDARNASIDKLPLIQKLQSEWEKAEEHEGQAKQRWQNANSALVAAQTILSEQERKWHQLIGLGPSGLAEMERSFQELSEQASSSVLQLEQAQKNWSGVGMSDEEFIALEQKATTIAEGAAQPQVRKGCRFLQRNSSTALSIQEPTDVVIYRQISPIRNALVDANKRANSARANLKKKRQEIAEFFGSVVEIVDSNTFVKLKDQLGSYYRLNATVAEKAESAAQIEAEVNEAVERCTTTLEQLGLALRQIGLGGQNVAQDLRRYYDLCDMKRKLEQGEDGLEKLKLREQVLQQQLAQLQTQQRVVLDLNSQLIALLAKAGIVVTPESIELGLKQFTEHAKNYGYWVKAERELDQALQRKQGLDQAFGALGLDDDLGKLDGHISELKRQLPDWEEMHASKTFEEYTTLNRDVTERIDRAKNDYQRLKDSIDRSKASLEHTAGIAEELGAAQRQVTLLERQQQIMEQAKAELEDAAREFQKQFAPKLAAILTDAVSRTTHRRYTTATVDPTTLAVQLQQQSEDRKISTELLSTGTRDLVYLVLRVGLAKLLSNANEQLPLMLDDPLVHLDSDRQTQMLDYFRQLCSETQILLFTKDDSILDWLQTARDSMPSGSIQLISLS